MPGNHQERGSEPTRDEVVPMLGEARMVVPGIQSLFGFQHEIRMNRAVAAHSSASR